MIIIDQVSCSQKNSHRETISSSQCLAFWQSSSFVAITVKLHRRISLTILQRCSLLKNMIRRETEAILAILLWLSCWCSFSAASKPKLSAVVFIIGCRREATPKIKTDSLICSSAYWLKTRAVAAHAARVNVREGQPRRTTRPRGRRREQRCPAAPTPTLTPSDNDERRRHRRRNQHTFQINPTSSGGRYRHGHRRGDPDKSPASRLSPPLAGSAPGSTHSSALTRT